MPYFIAARATFHAFARSGRRESGLRGSRTKITARAFAEGLRAVQADLGLSPTPLEIPDDEWSGSSGSVDFGDTELRGPTRSRIVREDRRKTRPEDGVAALARDEDTDFTSPARTRSRAMPSIIAGVSGTAVAAAAVLMTLLVTGVL